jgi:hypothetical protein
LCYFYKKYLHNGKQKTRIYGYPIRRQKKNAAFFNEFWVEFTEQLGVSLTDIGNVFNGGMSLSGIRALIYSAVRANDLEQGNDIDYTLYSVGEWLEELEAEAINDIVAVMMESKILGNSLSDSNAPKKPKPPKAQN